MGEANISANVAGGAISGSSMGPWGTIGGAALGALGSIAGGLISNESNEDAIERQVNFQRESMQNGIRWRVADAKAAGLHPLFALGANLPTPSPIVLGDQLGPAMAEASQNIGHALSKFSDQNARTREMLENNLLYKQMEEIDARKAAILSDTAIKENQYYASLDAAGKPGLGVQPEGQVPNVPGGQGMIDLKPQDQYSAKPGTGIVAGRHPAYQLYDLNGRPIILPWTASESPEEIISEMNPLTWAALLNRNRQFFGDAWFKGLMMERYGGMKQENVPSGKYWEKAKDLRKF